MPTATQMNIFSGQLNSPVPVRWMSLLNFHKILKFEFILILDSHCYE